MNSNTVTGLLMVSGFSGSGVVAEMSAVEVDLIVGRRSRTVSFMPFEPVNSATTAIVVVVSIVECLPVLAYVRRRVVTLPSRNCTSVLLVFVTGDWTVLFILFRLSLSLLTNWGFSCLLFNFTLYAC
jgi:hypothetical protein